MVPAGYLLKHVAIPSGWLAGVSSRVGDVCSVAACVNDNVVDVQGAWQHNGFGLANDPDVLASLVGQSGTDPGDAVLFYYTAYERELESDGWTFEPANWRPLSRARSACVADRVRVPPVGDTILLGYDVVVFGDFLEHSPLSCNSIAAEVEVNEHCLFATLDSAVAAIDEGVFGGGCEGGAYTVFAVHRIR